MIRRPAPLALGALLLTLTSSAGAQPQPPPQAADASTLSPAEQARRAQVLAHTGDARITVGEFEDMLNEAPAPIRQTYLDPARRREVLENYLQTMLLADEARRRGLDRDPDVAGSIRRILGQRLEQTAILEAITPATVTDAEVTAWYQSHREDYQQPEFRRATAVIVADLATAQRVLTDVRAAHNDLRRVREIVRTASVDEDSRGHEGDLFYFQRTGVPSGDNHAVDPALAAAVFALNRDMDVTPQPVAIAGGRFAVAVRTGMRAAMNRPITDPGVTASIRGYIVRERRAQREEEMVAAIRARVRPEVHPERLDALRIPPADQGIGNLAPFAPAPHEAH